MGYSQEEVSSIKGKTNLALTLKQELESVPDLQDAEPVENNNEVSEPDEVNTTPEMYSPEWHDYVMSLLRKDELIDGAPKCDGLRRLANILLGDIVFSAPTQVFPADHSGRATVVYTVRIAWKRDDYGYVDVKTFEFPIREFADVSDCSPENSVALYAKHASATASTRAEGRALRKALGLNICTAEELNKTEKTTDVNTNDVSNNISLHQKNFIVTKCQQLRIDPYKFINISHYVYNGPIKYKSLDEVTRETAYVMIEELNKFQSNSNDSNESTPIPEQLKA